MERDRPKGVVVGQADCTNCGRSGNVKANKKGHLYLYCDVPADGGCGTGQTSRSDAGDLHIARRVKKWVEPEHRKAYLGEAKPADPKPADPKPKAAPKPAPKVEESWP